MVDGATLSEPEIAPPVANPVPAHEVALVDDHDRVDDWPLVMDAGLAAREAVGDGIPPEARISNCWVNQDVEAPPDDVRPDDVPRDATIL